MKSIAREKFFSGSGPQRIWTRAIVVFGGWCIQKGTTKDTKSTKVQNLFILRVLRDLRGEN